MQGDEGMHGKLRQQVVEYMRAHEGDFAPFVEDDESFAQYMSRIKKDGVWAGYMEVRTYCVWLRGKANFAHE